MINIHNSHLNTFVALTYNYYLSFKTVDNTTINEKRIISHSSSACYTKDILYLEAFNKNTWLLFYP